MCICDVEQLCFQVSVLAASASHLELSQQHSDLLGVFFSFGLFFQLSEEGNSYPGHEPSAQKRLPSHFDHTLLATFHTSKTLRAEGDLDQTHKPLFSCPNSNRSCVCRTAGTAYTEGNETAVSGQSATLSCLYDLPKRVEQVLWTKTAEQGDTTTVASYGKHGQLTVTGPFAQRVSLSRTLGDTQLRISQVRMEDEGCYTCAFHTYPDGSKSTVSCLSVYGEPPRPRENIQIPDW